jgi:hypothetical protein
LFLNPKPLSTPLVGLAKTYVTAITGTRNFEHVSSRSVLAVTRLRCSERISIAQLAISGPHQMARFKNVAGGISSIGERDGLARVATPDRGRMLRLVRPGTFQVYGAVKAMSASLGHHRDGTIGKLSSQDHKEIRVFAVEVIQRSS